MGQVVVRHIDESVIARLKRRAAGQGLSLDELLRRALAELAHPSSNEFVEEQRRIQAMSPPIAQPHYAEDMIREDRDSR